MKRMAVFTFWEQKGIVREYVMTYLKGLMEVASKIYVVANGGIQDAGKRRIEEECGAIVLQRPNVGVDFWAYKTGMDAEGAGIADYDEVIFCNCSCYGPVYPFSEMFNEMGTRELDFWGITEWPKNADGFTGTWILSYFFVFRPHLFLSPEWVYYWKNLSEVYSRDECIEKHETKFTAYFADKGFSYGVYCPNKPGYLDMTIEAPDRLVIEQRCPLIKRKAFCVEYDRYLSYNRGDGARRVLEYLKKRDLYDVNVILDDLLATQHGAYLKDCLQLDYVLSQEQIELLPSLKQPKVAAFAYLQNENLLQENLRNLKQLPPQSDIYIVVSSAEFAALAKKEADAAGLCNVSVQEFRSAGGVIGALIHTANRKLMEYDYLCVIHDEQLWDPPVGIISEEIRHFNVEAVLLSKLYVENVLRTMENYPRLGMLIPMNALHGIYRARYGGEWGFNYKETVQLLEYAHVDIPVSSIVPPIAPLDAMFWIRPKCLAWLFDLGIREEDFGSSREEGTLYQVLLRAFPFFVQNMGYLTGQVISKNGAENHIVNLSYLLRRAYTQARPEIRIIERPVEKIVEIPVERVVEINIGLKRSFKEYLKKHLPSPIYRAMRWVYRLFK